MKLTGPIIIQNLLSAFVTSADVVMLNFVGQEHISAVSLAAQYASVLFMILYGLGTGVTMLSAQYFGKGDMRAVEAVQGIALRFSVGVSLLFSLAALALSFLMAPDDRVLSFLSDRVVPTVNLAISFLGMPLLLLLKFCTKKLKMWKNRY